MSGKMGYDGWPAVKRIYSSWGTQFTGRYDKVVAYAIIMLLMFFSTLDVIMDWSNYTDLITVEFEHGLVVGPPKHVALTSILVFCVFGSFLYALEVANVFTLMCNGGHTRIPMELEQSLVLMFEEIPLAAANLGIVMCRYDVITPTQTTTGVVALLSTCLRMYFYGWLKEYQFKYERTTYRVTIKAALYVTASAVWCMLFLICCFTWNHARISSTEFATLELKQKLLNGTSIFLIQPAEFKFGKYGKVRNFNLTELDSMDDIENSWLVHDLDNLIKAEGQRVIRSYSCERGEPNRKPPICKQSKVTGIKFLFYYRNRSFMTSRSPFGEVRYNFAIENTNGTCQSQTDDISPGWMLYYLNVENYLSSFPSNSTPVSLLVTTPWGNRTCVIAKPRFDKYLNPCNNSIGKQ